MRSYRRHPDSQCHSGSEWRDRVLSNIATARSYDRPHPAALYFVDDDQFHPSHYCVVAVKAGNGYRPNTTESNFAGYRIVSHHFYSIRS